VGQRRAIDFFNGERLQARLSITVLRTSNFRVGFEFRRWPHLLNCERLQVDREPHVDDANLPVDMLREHLERRERGEKDLALVGVLRQMGGG
jgi:hypothetical protein